MRRAILFCAVSAFVLTVASCSSSVRDDYSAFRQDKFEHPDNTFRSIPFYSINDSISCDELARQLKLFKEGGFGGAFLHSRIGLLTPYLSEEWFNIMDAGLKTCQELGIEAWYYDEDKWPSGFAGGIIPRQSVDYRSRALFRVDKDFKIEAPDRLLWEDGDYKYAEVVDPMGQPWYNGTCWVDLMNSDMVKAFIDCSYQPYVDRYAGKRLSMGIFTDEPQVSVRVSGMGRYPGVSYSPVMDSTFRKLWGYELAPHIPELFENKGDYRTVRLHYYRTVAYCMEMAFSKQLADYCEENGFIFTGHYNGEDNPSANMSNEGNLMQQLRHMQMPGCDALGLGFRDAHNGKVVSSVANQYGQKRRLSEIFGISGHNMSFEDRMWLTAWHTIVGINFMCPHLSLYSMKGERKRDYPPTFSYQQPYWSDNKLFEDFSARLCYFATVGKDKGEVCVISPIESDYIYIDPIKKDRWHNDTPFAALLESMFGCHVNFDIGDEQIISEIGRVVDGRFEIGQMQYSVVVLPKMITIRPTTLALLEKFAAAGGKVFVCDGYPQYVEGVEDNAAIERLKGCSTLFRHEDVADAMNSAVWREFSLSGDHADEIWTHLREVEGGYALQLSNTSRTGSRRVEIIISSCEEPMLWNPVNGEALSLEMQEDGSYLLDFAPAQTWMLTFGKPSRDARAARVYKPCSEGVAIAKMEGAWKGSRTAPNVLPLDFVQWSIDGGNTWSKPEPPLAIWDRFADAEQKYCGPMQLKYHFKIDALPAKCAVAVEQPWMYSSISVNGRPVTFGEEYYIDHIIRTGDITDKVVVGENEVLMSLGFRSPVPASADAVERYGTEIETIYVVGDFGVQGKLCAEQPATSERNNTPRLAPTTPPARYEYDSFVLTGEQREFCGDLTTAGYPFYAGGFELKNEVVIPEIEKGKCYKLCFDDAEAILVKVEVNGKAMPAIFASPWETDITSAVKAGRNEVKVTVVGSLRNLMGPYHNKAGEMAKVGPSTFRGRGDWPEVLPGDKDWYDARLRGTAKAWTDSYYSIPFGLLGDVTVQRY